MINLGTIMMAANKNMPAIMTGISIATGLAATLECARATIKAVKILEKMHYESDTEPTMMEKVKAVSPLYVRTLILSLMSVGFNFGSLQKGEEKLLATATLLAENEKQNQALENKLREKLGDKKVDEIHKEIIRDDIRKNPPKEENIYDTGTGKTLFRDGTMGGDFYADIEFVKHAFNEVDHMLTNRQAFNIVSANDLMYALNRPKTDIGEGLVWTPGDSLNVQIQQEEWSEDLYYAEKDELKTVWVITYTRPHELSDDHIG